MCSVTFFSFQSFFSFIHFFLFVGAAANLQRRGFELLARAYATVTVARAAELVGGDPQQVLATAQQQGWTYDAASQSLIRPANYVPAPRNTGTQYNSDNNEENEEDDDNHELYKAQTQSRAHTQ